MNSTLKKISTVRRWPNFSVFDKPDEVHSFAIFHISLVTRILYPMYKIFDSIMYIKKKRQTMMLLDWKGLNRIEKITICDLIKCSCCNLHRLLFLECSKVNFCWIDGWIFFCLKVIFSVDYNTIKWRDFPRLQLLILSFKLTIFIKNV